MKNIKIYFMISVFLIVFTGLAYGYGYRTCGDENITWDNSRVTMYISTTSFPPDSVWDTRLQNAMWHWNNVKGSNWNFYYGRDTDGSHNNSNDRTEIYLDGDEGPGGALAVTHMRWTCYWLFGYHSWYNEADLEFNSNYSWNTGTYSFSNPTGSPYSFEGVALHEMGHVLGLNHSDSVMATLNSYYPNSGPFGNSMVWDPHPDDRQGVHYLYSDSTTETDIACSSMRRTGSGTSNVTTSPSSASRGSSVTIQYTFSNLGTSTVTFNIGFYLSTNSYISTGDTLLGTNTGAWASAGAYGTYTRTLTIPTSISPGTYWLGVIVDYNGAVSESNESNNAVPMAHSITIN